MGEDCVPLSCDQRFQSQTVGNRQSGAVLLNETLFLETCEETADSLSRSTDHLANLLVRQAKFHLARIPRCGVLIKPSHHQPSQFFAGRVRKNEVPNLATGSGVIRADVLGDPNRQFAMSAHQAQKIALSQEADLARFLSLASISSLAAEQIKLNSK